MRLQYKITIVATCFIVFYIGITPIAMICVEPANNCTFIEELWISTRLIVPGGEEGIVEYTGSVQGIEKPNVENFILQNISFFVIMVIMPTCIILAVVLFEKRL